MITRRSFIKILAGISPIFLTQFKLLAPLLNGISIQDSSNQTGEIYAGFLILPENVPIPEFITPGGSISLEGSGNAQKGKTTAFASISEIWDYVHFPIFAAGQLPSNYHFSTAVLYQFSETNEVWAVRLDYLPEPIEEGQINIWALPDFPRPFPVWPVRDPNNPEGELISPQKIQLPQPALMIPSMLGYDFTWILGDILYSISVENHPDYVIAENIARSLQRINL